MPTQTTNYGLTKANPTDFYDKTTDNDNLDIIDTELKELSDAAGNIATLNTEQKNSLVVAVNELLTKIGALSSLTTTEKSNLVAAVNEIREQVMSHLADETRHITGQERTNWNNGIIVESGSNANGSYIKFADGTLICLYQLDNSTVTTTQITRGTLTLYLYTSSWYFPHLFINNKVSISISGKLGDSGGNTEQMSNAESICRWNNYSTISLTTFDSTYKTVWGLSVMAIGRWK